MARMLQQSFPRGSVRPWRAALLGAVALSALSCNAFRRTAGPEDAAPVNPPGTASVTIEYEQIVECVAGSPRCSDNVVFFGSWMQAGGGRIFAQEGAGPLRLGGDGAPRPGELPAARRALSRAHLRSPHRGRPHGGHHRRSPQGGRRGALAFLLTRQSLRIGARLHRPERTGPLAVLTSRAGRRAPGPSGGGPSTPGRGAPRPLPWRA